MQFQACRRVDIIGGQRRAFSVVEHHHAGPILLLVDGLLRAEKFRVLARFMIVLYAHHRVAIVTQLPEFGDIVQTYDVAIHEDRPTLISRQIWGEEARESKIGRLQIVAFAREHLADIGQGDRCDGQRLAGSRKEAVRQDVEGYRLLHIIANEYPDEVWLHQSSYTW